MLFRFARKVLERHDQLSAFGAEAFEPMVTVERLGRVVLGIDHQREDRDLGPGRADGRVCQQGATQFPPVDCTIDRESTDPGHRHRGVAWKSLRQRFGQVGQRYATGRQCVLANHLAAAGRDGDIAGAGPAAHVLRGLAGQVAVQFCNADELLLLSLRLSMGDSVAAVAWPRAGSGGFLREAAGLGGRLCSGLCNRLGLCLLACRLGCQVRAHPALGQFVAFARWLAARA